MGRCGKSYETMWNPICINLWKRGEDAGGLPFPLDQWTAGLRGRDWPRPHTDPHVPADVPYNAAQACLAEEMNTESNTNYRILWNTLE